MKLLTEALKQGKDIKDGPNGTRILGDEALTPERRWRFHKAFTAHGSNEQSDPRSSGVRSIPQAPVNLKMQRRWVLKQRDLSEQLMNREK